MNEQAQRLNKTIDLLLNDRSRIEAIGSLISSLIIIKPVLYYLTQHKNAEYEKLSSNYVSHLLSGKDSLCERYQCRDKLEEYKGYTELYCNCIIDEIWLRKELAALRIVELCRTGV